MSLVFKKAIFAASMCLLVAGAVRADIIISEVDSAGSAGSSGYAGDWFELTNTGASSVNISGWKVDDSSASFGSALALTGISSIAAGQSVVFMESPGGDTAAFLSAWGLSPSFPLGTYTGSGIGLSQTGDGVNIYNGSGVLQASVSFLAPTGTSTFDNAVGATGSISTASVVGVNGAYTSTAGEIGSPGTIGVPEPATLSLLASIAGALSLVRKNRNVRRSC